MLKVSTRMRGGLLVLAAVSLLTGLGPVGADTARAEELPSAEKVIEAFLEATGGRKAYETRSTTIMTGKMQVPAMGIEGSLKLYAKAPNFTRTEVEIPGMGTTTDGCNGEIAWESNFMTGARIKEGTELADALRQAAFNAEIRMDELYEEMTVTAKETVGENEAWKMELVPKTGNKMTHWYDAESGLLVKMMSVQQSPMGEIPVEVMVENYTEFDGMTLPTKMSMSMASQQMVMVFDSIELDPELPEGIFELPEEIAALQK